MRISKERNRYFNLKLAWMDADIFTLLLSSEQRIVYLFQISFPLPICSLVSCLPLSRFINLSVVRCWKKKNRNICIICSWKIVCKIRFIAIMIRAVSIVRHTPHQCDFLFSMAARWRIYSSPFLSLQNPYNQPAIYTAIISRGPTACVRVPPAVYTVLNSELSFVYTDHQPEARYSSLCSHLTHRSKRGKMGSYFSQGYLCVSECNLLDPNSKSALRILFSSC